MSTCPSSDLRVYIVSPHWGIESMSPFGTKLATWMRLAGIPHRLCFEDDPRKGPKSKTPWIVEDGVAMGDSELIIEHLKRSRGVDPDASLDARDRAIGLLLRRTYEEHFHQILEYALFCLDAGWKHSSLHLDQILPPVVGAILKPIIRKECRKDGRTRGVTRHTDAEIARLAAMDFEATEAILGDKPFLLGDHPTTTDCTVYGFLSHTLWSPIEYFAQDDLKQRPSLVAYCERVRERLWAEPAAEGDWAPLAAAAA